MTITAAQLQGLLGERYAIRHELGGGTLAAVFAADDLRHGRPVAIKLLRPEHATALAARSRSPPGCSIRISCPCSTPARPGGSSTW